MTFHVLDKEGQVSNELARKVTSRIHNIKEGFSSAGEFKDTHVVRLSVGSFHNSKEHILTYFEAIVQAALSARNE